MRCNGYIKRFLSQDEAIDEFGEPVAQQTSWSDPIPCSIKTNNDTRKGKYEDGEFRQASFIILIESESFDAERVKLSRLGEELGEYRIMSVEPLVTVGRTQIMV